MRRGKVRLGFIENSIARKVALTKRTVAISKKSTELEILCGVSVMFAFFNINEVDPFEVFPSLNAVKDVMSHVMNMPLIERTQKATTQYAYISKRITKESSELEILKKKNIRSEGLEFLCKVFEGSIEFNQIEERTIYCMNQVIDEKFQEIENINHSQSMNNHANEGGVPDDDVKLQFPNGNDNIVPYFNPPQGHFIGNGNFVPFLPPSQFGNSIGNILHYDHPSYHGNVYYPPGPQQGGAIFNKMVSVPWSMQPTLQIQYDPTKAEPSDNWSTYGGSPSNNNDDTHTSRRD
ncbi:MADS-box transcription factor 26-like [Impatiens glandulifera]|uniref:MADS-box transcription factor 26-like n=1 Tax=Impatiens glandulifera TaxID=253017 RepID=UPI001FB06BA6|nr:MADS-box transcription factor 26-like [Impatiens glandulifera]